MILKKFLPLILSAIALACAMNIASAKDAAPLADDPVTEQRLIAISEEMRCLVCQNESLAGSRSDLANDLRREIRVLIVEGKMLHAGCHTVFLEFLIIRHHHLSGKICRDQRAFRPARRDLPGRLSEGVVDLLAVELADDVERRVGHMRGPPVWSLADSDLRSGLAIVPTC